MAKKINYIDATWEIKRAKQFKDGNITLDIEVNGITIYGARVVKGKKNEFIAWPSYKGSDGNYYNHVYCPISQEEQDAIIKEVKNMI